jgi:hypothetical protein
VPILRQSPSCPAVRTATGTRWAYAELDDVIIMPPDDQDAIDTLAQLVHHVLTAQITSHDQWGSRPLVPADIAVGVTHRDQRDPRCPEHAVREFPISR